jgi:predicted nucleic acid-binding Zn ribbon protein
MRKAGDIISLLFKQRFGEDFMENARSSAELFNSWEKTVCQVWPRGDDQKNGDIPAAAVHSRIKELEHGILLVEADHPGWIQILQTKQAELLQAVQRRCPKLDIRGIAFRLEKKDL